MSPSTLFRYEYVLSLTNRNSCLPLLRLTTLHKRHLAKPTPKFLINERTPPQPPITPLRLHITALSVCRTATCRNTTLSHHHHHKMEPACRHSELSITSDCSSAYSFDGRVSDTNLTSTQIHHRSRPESDITDKVQNDAERAIDWSSTSSQMCSANVPVSTSALDNSDAQYRFETPEKAEEPHRQVVEKAQADGGNRTFNPDANSVGPRPPTPPRRRPRIESIDSYVSASRRNTSASLASQSHIPAMESRDLANEYIVDIGPRRTVRDTVHSFDPISESAEPHVLRNAPMIKSQDNDAEILRQQEQRANALQALSCPVRVPSPPIGLEREASGISRETSGVVRRQGKVNWRDDITDNTIDRASSTLVSATGNEYGLGDNRAGYCSGVFVTSLQETEPQSGERRESRLKRTLRLKSTR